MGRILLITALLYWYGDPGFDGHRPASLDRPLRNLHRAIETVANDARRAVVALDNNAANLISTIPQLGEKLRRIGVAVTPN